MNVNLEMALRLINLGAYERAVEELKKAISAEKKNQNKAGAVEIRCILGELYGNLDMKKEAKAEFKKVIEYCDETKSLPKQREIAENYLASNTKKK